MNSKNKQISPKTQAHRYKELFGSCQRQDWMVGEMVKGVKRYKLLVI